MTVDEAIQSAMEALQAVPEVVEVSPARGPMAGLAIRVRFPERPAQQYELGILLASYAPSTVRAEVMQALVNIRALWAREERV